MNLFQLQKFQWLEKNKANILANFKHNEHAREIIDCYTMLAKTKSLDQTMVAKLEAAIAKYKASLTKPIP